MKLLFSYIFVLGFLSVFAGPDALPVRVDTNHSTIGFEVPIMGGLSQVTGKFSRFETDLKYDRGKVTASSIRVKIDAASVDTGIDQRDAHLRTADFFETDKYPDIVFVSKKVEARGGGYLLIGDLTMHGVTKTVEIPFSIAGFTEDKEKGTYVTGFKGELTLNRREYGINYEHQTVPGFIGDNVRIKLNLLTRPAKIDTGK